MAPHVVTAPPQHIVDAVERAAPGFWGAWRFAVVSAHGRSAPWIVTSWWRSRALNLSVGGAPGSQHLLGTAFDLGQNQAAAAELRRVGFIVVESPDHLHAQPWPANAGLPLLRSLDLV